MTPKRVCILNEVDARAFAADIGHKCSSRRHHHFRRADAAALVKAGELVWVGMNEAGTEPMKEQPLAGG